MFETNEATASRILLVMMLMSVLVVTFPHEAAAQNADISDLRDDGTVLKGKVEMREVHALSPLIGVWKVKVKRFPFRRKLDIQRVEDDSISGTYTGLLGTFPMTGRFDEQSGSLQLFVDFSRSRLTRLPRLSHKNLVAEIHAQLINDEIRGTGSLPDVSRRMVHWQARKVESL